MRERQLGFRETLETIVREKRSFARFGDGELKLMLRADYNLKFQTNSANLRRELEEALVGSGDVSGLLTGFPHAYTDLHWTGVWLDLWTELEALIPEGGTFGNSHVSRPIFFQQMGQEGVDLWRQVWEKEDVCLIAGRESRFNRIPALFDNVSTWRRIDSSPTNAYDDIERLLDEVRRDTSSSLFLVALGPAGTVLSHRIAQDNRRAVDIGHISDSYSNVFEGGCWPEKKSVTTRKC
nr:GT-D fold domain-containing glycosyltransferase [Halomonas getboli]